MHLADVAEIVVALFKDEAAEPFLGEEMAVSFIIQFETGGPVFTLLHPLGQFFAKRPFFASVACLTVGIDIDFPDLAAGMTAGIRLALEVRENLLSERLRRTFHSKPLQRL